MSSAGVQRFFPGKQVADYGSSRSVPVYPGLTADNPATSGVQLYDLGLTTSGVYYINTANGGVKQVYVDLQTQDNVTGKAGWMLVGSWATAYAWQQQAATSSAVFDTTIKNCFSSNFGSANINFMRMQVASSISTTKSLASADWYFYWQSATAWRSVWVPDASTNYWSSTVNAGTSTPRESLKQFTHAYNLKFSYQVGQQWNNLSDGASSPNAGRQGDWWNGLGTAGTSIGWSGAGDGSLAILPQGSSSTGAGQDCNEANAKIGYDDTVIAAWYGGNATDNMNANTGTFGTGGNLYMWIK